MDEKHLTYFKDLRKELVDREWPKSVALLDRMLDAQRSGDAEFQMAMSSWAEKPTTVGLRDLAEPFGSYWKDHDFAFAVDGVDAATLAVNSIAAPEMS